MKILLDTHVIIWVLTDDTALSENARASITDPNNTIYYSIASIWEIAIKNAKSPDRCPYNEKEIADLCDKSGFLPLDITIDHIQGLRNLKVKSGKELSNHDPFDRILLSQAKSENMKLFSHDSNFGNYDEKNVWMI
ncbi:MAG: type II toxin-antitoxin system VapC family toxin [Lachnospiraceae bacterium]|nr:type II toxin-antitoxin system VapC family toxin [Lachnospiraceae bacterium]